MNQSVGNNRKRQSRRPHPQRLVALILAELGAMMSIAILTPANAHAEEIMYCAGGVFDGATLVTRRDRHLCQDGRGASRRQTDHVAPNRPDPDRPVTVPAV